MPNDNDEIIDDPLTDTQKKLRAIVVDAVREVIAEERRRFDWLKFVRNWLKHGVDEIDKRMK